MDSNLVIDDDYVTAVANSSNTRGAELEKIYSSYLTILKDVRANAIKDGETALALSDFIKCVELLQNQLGNISGSIQTDGKKFLVDVNEADQYLF